MVLMVNIQNLKLIIPKLLVLLVGVVLIYVLNLFYVMLQASAQIDRCSHKGKQSNLNHTQK